MPTSASLNSGSLKNILTKQFDFFLNVSYRNEETNFNFILAVKGIKS